MEHFKWFVVPILVFIVACSPAPTPTSVPPTTTPFPPTLTATPSPTATITATRQPTLTPKPTDTPTPVPTPRPTAIFPASGDSTLALINGVLIDRTGADPLRDAIVVIRKGRIVAVGSRSKVELPADAKIDDVQGATILPGFINAHVHAGRARLQNWTSLRTWASTGVTTVRGMTSSGPRDDYAFRSELLRDNKNARLVLATPMLTVPNGYPMARFGVSPNPWGLVTSPDDGAQKANQYLDYGADLIKVAIDSGEGSKTTWPTLSREEATAIVRVAHQRGVKVSSHTTGQRDLPQVLDAGVDDIAHMATVPVPDLLIERIVKANVYWVPTLEL